MPLINYILASIPLLFPARIAIDLLDNPWAIATGISRWLESSSSNSSNNNGGDGNSNSDDIVVPSVSSQLLVYLAMGIFGYALTDRLVPNIKVSVYKVYIYIYIYDSYLISSHRRHYIAIVLNYVFCFFVLSCNVLYNRNTHFEREFAGKIWEREGRPWLINRCKFFFFVTVIVTEWTFIQSTKSNTD